MSAHPASFPWNIGMLSIPTGADIFEDRLEGRLEGLEYRPHWVRACPKWQRSLFCKYVQCRLYNVTPEWYLSPQPHSQPGHHTIEGERPLATSCSLTLFPLLISWPCIWSCHPLFLTICQSVFAGLLQALNTSEPWPCRQPRPKPQCMPRVSHRRRAREKVISPTRSPHWRGQPSSPFPSASLI